MSDPNALVTLAIMETPAIIEMVKSAFAKKNPTAPPLTDDDVKLALSIALKSSLDKDDQWQAIHPQKS
jgi:hypothetical protein